MYGCESWTIKKAECQRTDAFELCCWKRLLRVPWTARRSNQSIWNSNTLAKNWLIGKDPDAGKDWRQKEKGMAEDKMVGWHHRLNGHESEQSPGVGGGQGRVACCRPWGCKASDTTEQLNLLNWTLRHCLSHSLVLFPSNHWILPELVCYFTCVLLLSVYLSLFYNVNSFHNHVL